MTWCLITNICFSTRIRIKQKRGRSQSYKLDSSCSPQTQIFNAFKELFKILQRKFKVLSRIIKCALTTGRCVWNQSLYITILTSFDISTLNVPCSISVANRDVNGLCYNRKCLFYLNLTLMSLCLTLSKVNQTTMFPLCNHFDERSDSCHSQWRRRTELRFQVESFITWCCGTFMYVFK